jgi:adenylate cyclase
MAATGRLIAILAADVVGYSGLIGTDGEGTLERLEAHRHQLVYPKITEHHGHIVRATGDSLLVEFASPTEAVRCAVAVQRGMIDRNIGTAPDRRITYRVGVNIGEVTAIGDDLVSRTVAALPTDKLASLIKPGTKIYGDGGSIAVRVAALADPAGICISGTVRDAIRDQLPYTFEDIGKQNLDTRAAPVQCYAMSADSVASRPRVAAQKQRGSTSRRMRLRSAAAASVFAMVGICAVALWAWFGANSSTALIPALVTVGSHMPSVGSTAADSDTQAPSPPQPPPVSNKVADRDTQARSLPNIGAAVVRGKQPPSALQTAPNSGTAVVRGNQAPSAVQITPDSGTAVVRGHQVPSTLQTTPDSGTAVIRGNQAPSTLQITPDSGTDAARGT